MRIAGVFTQSLEEWSWIASGKQNGKPGNDDRHDRDCRKNGDHNVVRVRQKPLHQRKPLNRLRTMIMSAVAKKSADDIPPTVLVVISPVTETTVSFPAAVSRKRMMAIGMIKITPKNVVIRFSFAGESIFSRAAWVSDCVSTVYLLVFE